MRTPKEAALYTTVVTIEDENPKTGRISEYFLTAIRNGQPYNVLININGPVKIRNKTKCRIIRYAALKMRGAHNPGKTYALMKKTLARAWESQKFHTRLFRAEGDPCIWSSKYVTPYFLGFYFARCRIFLLSVKMLSRKWIDRDEKAGGKAADKRHPCKKTEDTEQERAGKKWTVGKTARAEKEDANTRGTVDEEEIAEKEDDQQKEADKKEPDKKQAEKQGTVARKKSREGRRPEERSRRENQRRENGRKSPSDTRHREEIRLEAHRRGNKRPKTPEELRYPEAAQENGRQDDINEATIQTGGDVFLPPRREVTDNDACRSHDARPSALQNDAAYGEDVHDADGESPRMKPTSSSSPDDAGAGKQSDMPDTPSCIRTPSHPLNSAPHIPGPIEPSPEPLQGDSGIKRGRKPSTRPKVKPNSKPKATATSTPKASDKTRTKASPKKLTETAATGNGTSCQAPKAQANSRENLPRKEVAETEATKNATSNPPLKRGLKRGKISP